MAKMLLELGAACTRHRIETLVNLPCKRLQCDEIWSYNFGRIHETLRVTPPMEAGVASHVWSVEEIVGLLG